MAGSLVCDQSNGWPTEINYENLATISTMGVKVAIRVDLSKVGPTMHLKDGCYNLLQCSGVAL